MITLFNIRPKGLNVGNDVISLAMQHYLGQAFDQPVNVIALPAQVGYQSQGNAGLLGKVIYDINQFGDGVIVGGGNLYENSGLQVDVNALKALNVPLMLFSLSWGHVFGRHGKWVKRTDALPDETLRALHAKSQISVARDQATYDHLQQIGASNCTLGGCPTLFINRAIEGCSPILERQNQGVLISIRNPALMNVPLRRKPYVREELQQLVALMRERGHDYVRLLCHDQRDLEFASTFDEVEYVYTDDPYRYLAMLQNCELSVSYRLHATVPCLSLGKKVINISYDERGMSLMQTIGMGEWDIQMNKHDSIIPAVIERYEKLDSLPQQVAKVQPIWQELDQVMKTAFAGFARLVKEGLVR